MRKAIKTVETVITSGFVTLFSITCISPTTWTIYPSLKTDQESSLDILSLPKKLIFDNYARAIEKGNIGSYFMSNTFNTLITVVVVIMIAFMAGYRLFRFKFRGRAFICYMFLSGMLIPIYALLIPILVESKLSGLLNKRYTSILPYIAFAPLVAASLVEGSVTNVSAEIEEAVCIDGNSFLHTMFATVMPMCRPMLSISATLTFLNTWNESPLALVSVRSNSPKTMPVGPTNFAGSYTVSYPPMLTALVVSTFPVVIMHLLFYNQIMEGMTAGAVKG